MGQTAQDSHFPRARPGGAFQVLLLDILAGRRSPTLQWIEAITKVLEIDAVDIFRPPGPAKG